MSRETELDDLDLDKLLDDEDFLEDFELDEVVSGSEPEAASDFPLEMETAVPPESPAAEPAASGDDSSAAVDPESPAAGTWWQKFVFPAAVFLAVLLLLLQLCAARKIFFPEIHISSKPQKIAVAEIINRDLSEIRKKASEAKSPPRDITTFNFYYPLYSLSGLKILGVEVQLVFPPQDSPHLKVEQIARLKAIMHDSLDQAVGGRMLEELGNHNDFLAGVLQESLSAALKQWHLSPDAIRLENLVVH